MTDNSELVRLVAEATQKLDAAQKDSVSLLRELELYRDALIKHSETASSDSLTEWLTEQSRRYKAVRDTMNKAFEKVAEHEQSESTASNSALKRIYLNRALQLEHHAILETEIHNGHLRKIVEEYLRKAEELGVSVEKKAGSTA